MSYFLYRSVTSVLIYKENMTYQLSSCVCIGAFRQHQWSWGNVLVLRSKICEFKPAEVIVFFQDIKILRTSPQEGL